eukprot:m.264987 g.264987  ORF g.264987 m.264987 type:complete len:104 (+) comp59199_c0_seq1:429-740(+)
MTAIDAWQPCATIEPKGQASLSCKSLLKTMYMNSGSSTCIDSDAIAVASVLLEALVDAMNVRLLFEQSVTNVERITFDSSIKVNTQCEQRHFYLKDVNFLIAR